MSSYVASARIAGHAPQLVRRPPGVEEAGTREPLVATVEPLVDPDGADGLTERLSAARERWSQLTFFLFDPNSWR